MKKSTIIIGILVFAIIGTMIYFQTYDQRKLNNYTEDKFGFEVELVEKGQGHTGNMGNVTHIVAKKDNPEFVFGLKVDGDFFLPFYDVVGDAYYEGEKAYNKYIKLKPYIPKIKELGFTRTKNKNYLSYEVMAGVIYRINLRDSKALNLEFFEDDWLERYDKLIKYVQKADADVDDIRIRLTFGSSGEDTLLFIKDPLSIESKEQLYYVMKNSNDNLASYHLAYKMDDFLSNLENDRFHFKGSHEADELGVNCGEVDKNGDCNDLRFFIDYQSRFSEIDVTTLEEDIKLIVKQLDQYVSANQKYSVSVEHGYYFKRAEIDGPNDLSKVIKEAKQESR